MNVKSWHWFDYVLIGIRTIWFISRLADVQTHTGNLNVENRFAVFGIIWLDVFLLSVAFAVPLMVFAFKKVPRTVMILTEIIVSGGVLLYFLSDFGLEAGFAFYGVPMFMIGYLSFGWASAWSLPVALLPLIGKLMWDQSFPEFLPALSSDLVLLFFLGFCFGKMKDSFIKVKQMNSIIQRQNQTLENYAEQIERLTLVEERNRLSRDLHDTVGHTLTTSIIGMNAARILIDVSPEEAKKNLNELVEVTRNGLQEVRNHIHQIAPEKEERPLSIILSDIADEFALHTGTEVNMRVEGKETHVSENIRMALVRCLQESMTNAKKAWSRRQGRNPAFLLAERGDVEGVEQRGSDGRHCPRIRASRDDGKNGQRERHLACGIGSSLGDNDYVYGSFVEAHRERTVGICFRGIFHMKEIKILIAEDQELIRKSLRIILNLTPDIEVVGTAENGEDAVQQAGELQPDLVLMDIHMPVMNGVRATAQIKQRWPAVKVMILTTFQEVEYVVEALNSGAEGYILKDIDPDDLASAIRLVHRGETMITQEIAKTLFSRSFQGGIASSGNPKETDYGLTEKEIKVLQLIAEGLANRQIAERLFLSEGTVKNHVSTIYSKLNVNNRASAMKKASDERLL
ncbi:hypothetical protein SD71_01210 [Cohnella kolymensis]|uniref:Chemotaxis protein CheY n=1 Tax=Cohnella kolymensis TaxID=1590652 RepID=A0ABR5A8E8_9BACL|nr:response regulator transcription factor family protein [Cohnella kolymensis]KIL37334.1 hypothetical protein SD71_01210 [Cohnella kolymensis]